MTNRLYHYRDRKNVGIQVFLREYPDLFVGGKNIIGRIYSGDLILILKKGDFLSPVGWWYQILHNDLVGWACIGDKELVDIVDE